MKHVKLRIHGMHCASCETLIERKFRAIPGIQKVNVKSTKGTADVWLQDQLPLTAMQDALKDDGYTISRWDQEDRMHNNTSHHSRSEYLEMGGFLVLFVGMYLILRQLHLLPDIQISEHMSLVIVLGIGLVAAFSTCMSVTGGLLLAVTERYRTEHPELSGVDRFRPQVAFHLGRLISYALLGGLVGVVGSTFTFSPVVMTTVTILVSMVMLILGLKILNLVPWLHRFQLRMPKFIAHRVHRFAETKTSSFLLGAATFFLPCGFTQALQLYVLSTGSFQTGAVTMLVFALGTLPALLSVGLISSFSAKSFQRHFLKAAGVLVILIAVFQLVNTTQTLGIPWDGVVRALTPNTIENTSQGNGEPGEVTVTNGVQVATMKVVGYNYVPSTFVVKKNIPVEWHIDGSEAAGCAQVITVPSLRKTEYLPPEGETVITFTPTTSGRIAFRCTMGMTTPGAAFIVED